MCREKEKKKWKTWHRNANLVPKRSQRLFFFLETTYKDLDKSRSLNRFWWLTTNVMSYIKNTKTFFLKETIYKDLDKLHSLSHFWWLITNVMSYIQNTKTFFFFFFWRKSHFRPYIFRRFPLWSLDFIFTVFSPYPEKRFPFWSLSLHQRRKVHTWQIAEFKKY